MPKSYLLYVCRECGAQSAKFGGRCHECGAWNSLDQIEAKPQSNSAATRKTTTAETVSLLSEIQSDFGAKISCGIQEADRALGGGITQGSIILLGGEPGIGKSTLLLQIAAKIGAPSQPVLYVSAEESREQIKIRADRLGITGATIKVASLTSVESIIDLAETTKPPLLIVDSIQTILTDSQQSAPGSISQVRECGLKLMRLAKDSNIAVILIGHVTKDGLVAGPRALEHMVDVVLYLEGSRFQNHRLLRSVKNRFGQIDLGVFEMQASGLMEVEDPSNIFLSAKGMHVAGSAITCCIEGSRPLLIEIQALASTSAYGSPTRTAMGIDHTRVVMLIAILSKRMGLRLHQHDIYVNIAGGIELEETACDTAIAAAIASSALDRQIGPNIALFGEVGLGGELRPITNADIRIKEAARLGFTECVIPAGQFGAFVYPEMRIHKAEKIADAIEIALGASQSR